MVAFIIRRLVQSIFIILLVTILSFFLIHLIPGDPVKTMLGFDATLKEISELRHELWLDRPIIIQYFHWLGNLVKGDFGMSIMYREDVMELIRRRLPVTLYFSGIALIFACTIGISLGVISGIRRGSFTDSLLSIIANLGLSVPMFWLGILGIYFISLKLGLLPIQGFTSPFDDLSLSIKKVIMPSFVLSVIPLSAIMRQTRSAMLEVTRQDYIRTAWAKGLKERVIVLRHGLKNCLIPVITLIGVYVRFLVGGSVIVETVFNIPGMGRMIVSSVFDKDFVIVQACVLVIAVVVVLANLLVDISYGFLDPRIRYD